VHGDFLITLYIVGHSTEYFLARQQAIAEFPWQQSSDIIVGNDK
jgi:hypothetical protein